VRGPSAQARSMPRSGGAASRTRGSRHATAAGRPSRSTRRTRCSTSSARQDLAYRARLSRGDRRLLRRRSLLDLPEGDRIRPERSASCSTDVLQRRLRDPATRPCPVPGVARLVRVPNFV
jgi:hypothetical protein